MECTCQSNIQQQTQHNTPVENTGVNYTVIIIYTHFVLSST